jgi:hypothetical protein
MKKSHTQNNTPGSVQREQEIKEWDGWGSAGYSTPPEGSNLSGDNNKEVDSLVSDLFQEPAETSC